MLVIDDQGEDSDAPNLKEIDHAETEIVPKIDAPKLEIPKPQNVLVESDYAS